MIPTFVLSDAIVRGGYFLRSLRMNGKIRDTKSEIPNNIENESHNVSNIEPVLSLGHLKLEIVSCFEIMISVF